VHRIIVTLLLAGLLFGQDSGGDPAAVAKQLMDKRDYDGAIQAWRAALAQAAASGERKAEAQAWLMTGRCLTRKQQLAQAVDAFNSAAKVAAAAGDNGTLGDALNEEMKAEYGLGRFKDAEAHGRRAGEAFAAAGDQRMVVGTEINVAVILGEKGDLEQKGRLLRQAIREAEAGGYDNFLANGLNNLGVLYCEQGDYGRGVQYLDRATELASRITPDDHARLAMFRTNLGEIYVYLGQTGRALAEHAKAATEARAAGDEAILMGIRTNRANAYSQSGDYARALAEVQPAIEYFDHSDQRRDAFFSYNDQLVWMVRAGRYQDAVARGEKLLPEARRLGPLVLYRLLDPLGDAYAGLQRFSEARKSYLDAIAAIESVKLSGSEDEKESFFHEKCGPYLGMVRLLVRDGKPFEALQYSERAKARLLLDVLRGARTEINRAMTEEEKQRERDLTNRIVRLDARLAADGVHAQPETLAERDRLKSEMDAMSAELYREHPELRVQRGEFRPLAEAELAKLLGSPQTAVVEFAVVDRAAYVFTVTLNQRGAPQIEAHTLKMQGLEEEVTRFRRQLANRDLDYRESAKALYARLLGPVAASLRNKTRVVVVPDGPLWELPFQALITPAGKHLMEDATVSYVSSLGAAREMRALPRNPVDASRTLLAIGAPAKSAASLPVLREASMELRQVEQIYGAKASQILMGEEAVKERWKTEAPSYRILHVATHGVMDSNNPLSSYLDLNRTGGEPEDGVLSAREILKMSLRADLAVLSACEMARGRYRFGEGMIGMSWAFLIAGTPTTVVSQWKVDSASTTQLMLGFHRNLRSHANFSGKADALRTSALALLQDPQYKHPFYWAGFVVVGDGF